MEVELEFVPPGGGPVEYSLIIDFPALPRAGDQLSIRRPPDQTDLFAGTIDFIVRSVRWELEYPDNEIYEDPTDPNVGQTRSIIVECEFALGPFSSGAHKAACQAFSNNGKLVKRLREKT